MFELNSATRVLARTPGVQESILIGLSPEWTENQGQSETWSPYDIIGHLIHGEKTDWIPRMKIILSGETDRTFTPFDRFAQFKESKGKVLTGLLTEFRQLRESNIAELEAQRLTETDMEKTGVHPTFGTVTLSQLLSTWVVHDLNHIAQITGVMASRYRQDVGPWTEFLKILRD
ncbi:MAG: DinB family protein [Ignavibacteria bacterium]|nr:DinB family protein [Ignavibacteria bacterium]